MKSLKNEIITDSNLAYDKMLELLYCSKWPMKIEDRPNRWGDYEIYAKTTKNIVMSVWDGTHDSEGNANCKEHICKKGTKVRVWMVSRFGDVGITDNIKNPRAYDARVDPCELTDFQFIELNKNHKSAETPI